LAFFVIQATVAIFIETLHPFAAIGVLVTRSLSSFRHGFFQPGLFCPAEPTILVGVEFCTDLFLIASTCALWF